MEVVCQGNDSFLEEFELSLSEHPWDEAQVDDARKHPIPTADHHNVVAPDQAMSTNHDLFHTLIAEILDNGSTIPVANDGDDEELYDDSAAMIHHHEEYIEISPMVRTNLFTIFEEEHMSISDDSMMIRHFRPVSLQKAHVSRSETRLGISSRTQDNFASTENRKTRFHFLKKVQQIPWIRRNSTSEEAKSRTSFENNGHGMPFYSVRSILNDLEALSVLSEKSVAKTEEAKTDSKGKRAWLQMKNGSIQTKNRKETDDGMSTARTQVTRNPCRLPLSGQRHSLSDVSASVSEVSEESPPARCNPIRVLCRLRAGRSRREKRHIERNDPSVKQHQKAPIDKKPQPHRSEAKNATKITIVHDINGIEKPDRTSSVETIPVSQLPTMDREASQKPRDQVQADFAEKEFQSHSYGIDMVALLSDTLMDMTSILGGKMDHACCAGKERDDIQQKEEVSIILVGSSESVGELTLTSHEMHINQLEAIDEAKHCDE